VELTVGTQVTANVHLVELLGEGGMGSVWVAEHEGLQTRVAVKFIAADLIREDPTLLERFNREAALTAQIKSPNVVQTFDHGVMDDGRPYIVMELLDGEPLSDLMKRDGQLTVEQAEAVVRQTGKALGRAHKLDIVHRDIKPENLFLEQDEDEELFLLKVLDFGIAKQTNLAQPSNVTSTNMMVGTPEYMSPEQVLSSKTVDGQADCWSLAVVAYRCLTGGVPFTGETVGAVAVAIASGVFTPVTRYRPDLPPAMDAWFARALTVDPSGRFSGARELARAFSAAVRGESLDGGAPETAQLYASEPPPGMPLTSPVNGIPGAPPIPVGMSGTTPHPGMMPHVGHTPVPHDVSSFTPHGGQPRGPHPSVPPGLGSVPPPRPEHGSMPPGVDTAVASASQSLDGTTSPTENRGSRKWLPVAVGLATLAIVAGAGAAIVLGSGGGETTSEGPTAAPGTPAAQPMTEVTTDAETEPEDESKTDSEAKTDIEPETDSHPETETKTLPAPGPRPPSRPPPPPASQPDPPSPAPVPAPEPAPAQPKTKDRGF